MDRRTLVAVAACLLFLFTYPMIMRWAGFGQYLAPAKSAHTADSTAALAGRTPPSARGTAIAPAPSPAAAGGTSAAATPATASGFRPMGTELEKLSVIETPLYRATFTNRGARLLSIELKQFAASRGPGYANSGKAPVQGKPVDEADRVRLAGDPSFAIDLGSDASLRPLDDVVYGVAESRNAAGDVERLTFTAVDSTGMLVRQTWQIHPDDYALDLEVELRNVPAAWRLTTYSLTCRSWPLLNENNSQDEERSLKATTLVGANVHREPAGSLRKAPKRFDGNVQWVAVQTRYFVGGIAVVRGTAQSAVGAMAMRPLTADQLKRLPPDWHAEQAEVSHALVMGLPGETNPVNRFLVYFGPNDHFRL
jgi:YidC/Oxa1 family membrane protein insertase